MTTDIGEDAPAPRLCHITRWPDFDGYGFNLQSDKVRNGQFIGKVDANSPAEAAGLKQGDRIVEVNGVNIANENHKQVVERIKAIPQETRLLVVDPSADAWYKTNKVVVRGTQKNILYLQNPVAFRFTHDSISKDSPQHHEFDEKPINHPSTDSVNADRRSSVQKLQSFPPFPPGSEVADAHQLDIPTQTEQERKVSVQESPILRQTVDLHFPPPPPLEDYNTPEKTHHEEKRQSITFTEHAPVTVTQPQHLDKSDDHKNRHEDDHHNHEKAREAGEHSHDHSHTGNEAMQHTYQETVVTHDVETAREEHASQLTGFKVLGEDIEVCAGQPGSRRHSILADPAHHEQRRLSNTSPNHVHFEQEPVPLTVAQLVGTPDLDASQMPKVYPKSPVPSEKEFIEETVTRSPAFHPQKPVSPKEELTETVEVHHNNGYQRPVISYTERLRKDSLSEDSGSRSLSSAAENHSDKENGLRSRNGDNISYDDSKTPSPTPAVIAPLPVKPVSNGTAKPVTTEPTKTTPKSGQTFGEPSLYQSAQELRAALSRRPKKDIRSQPMDLKKKHDIINNL
ncbi:uncharacterized protein LOC129601500 isoform X2 [Paramacrobiotus metropolitanus]|uniref:uncharacterized protein LOC129601500 isoform X2 n=1 Tax=Paramacrobiotus metropolitanus TaxID=2943436 RepID=UPI0024461489|nr:uncharacterized protein LOC129601500 isoform X2 [Paramacrobiotus metropolitanus]